MHRREVGRDGCRAEVRVPRIGGIRKSDTALRDKLNAGIAAVVKSGKYDEMMQAYPGLSDQIQKPQI